MTNLTDIRSNVISAAGAGLTVYSTLDSLPTSGLEAGDQAFVSGNQRFYISNGNGWYNAALVNATPTLSIDPSGIISLNTDGSTTTITLTATDSDYPDNALTFSVESDGNFIGLGTVSQDSSVFTITPLSEDSATTTQAVLTFKASDGISFGSGDRTLKLVFALENIKYTTLLLRADSDAADNQVDASSTSTAITEVGNVTSAGLTPYHPGGYSYHFVGDGGDYFEITSPSTDLSFGTGDFCIEMWIYPKSTANSYILADMRPDETNGSYIGAFSSGSGNPTVYINNSQIITTSGAPLSAHAWHHLVLNRDGTDLSIFVDGTREGTATNSTNLGVGEYRLFKNAYSAGGIADGEGGYIYDYRVVKGNSVYGSGTTLTVPTSALTTIDGTALHLFQNPGLTDKVDSGGETITFTGGETAQFTPFDYQAYTKSTGGSVYFDGSGDYLRTATLLETNSDTFTIEGWVYYSAASISSNVAAFFCDSHNLGGTIYGPSFGTNASRQLIFRWYNSAEYTCTSSEAVPYNAWTHIAVVVNSNSIQFYINGKAATMSGTTTYSGTNGSSTYATIGANDKGAFTGYIADFRLTTSAVYTADFTPPTSPLTDVTNTKLLTCTNKNDIWDNASGNVAIKTGNASVSTAQRKFTTSDAMYFDGTGDEIEIKEHHDEFTFGDGDWTIEWWFYATSTSGTACMITTAEPTDNQGCWYGFNNGNLYILHGDGGSAWNAKTGAAISTNTWYHCAVVNNGGTYSVYLNGSTTTSGISSYSKPYTWTNSNNAIHVGGRTTAANQRMTGYLQDVRVTKGLARYTANFTPPTAEHDG